MNMFARTKAHLEALNGRLREAIYRAVAVVKDARVRFSGGAKARRWVSTIRHGTWLMWCPTRQRRQAVLLLTDADLYRAAKMNPNIANAKR